MQNLFERSNVLNEPIECFLFDAKDEVFPVKSHWHYFAELIFMRSGTAVLTADGTAYTLSAGDLFIVPPAAVHAITAPEGVLPVYEVLKFDEEQTVYLIGRVLTVLDPECIASQSDVEKFRLLHE